MRSCRADDVPSEKVLARFPRDPCHRSSALEPALPGAHLGEPPSPRGERVGEQCKAADQGRLQEELKPRGEAAWVLVVEVDGSMLPIRGADAWKEAKVGVLYRHDAKTNAPIPKTSRYVAVVNGLGEFAPVLEEALEVENIDEVGKVVRLGDGAACNRTLADQLAPDAWPACARRLPDRGCPMLQRQGPGTTRIPGP